jgi:alkylation response protein AidB-like acyl-CoA dehydrogenase
MVEVLCGANQSWTMYPTLAHGIYQILSRHGAPGLQAAYLPQIVSGEWITTMCLTEAHCGSDLGLLRTRAEPDAGADAHGLPGYRLHGSKIFISSGEHEITPNIIHMVLARLPDAPAGVKGISLFLVPKLLPDGSRNGIFATAVEHKMGLRGSATCAMSLEGAVGWLVGEAHQGLAAMFILMNEARLNVGVQALAVAQGAYDAALAYARERLQMRGSAGAKRPDLPADPIVLHADVRRMLLTQKAHIEGGRLLSYWLALNADLEAAHPDAAVRREASELLALLTPIAKAFLSDNAYDDANLALQIFGGHGYLRDHGVEQRVRDIRITQIYEGTNGVQARDLLSRKILGDGGQRLSLFLARVRAFCTDVATPAEFAAPLRRLAEAIEQAVREIAERDRANREETDAAATDLLQAFGHLVLGYCLAQAAIIALPKASGDDPFYASKVATARFYLQRRLPRAHAHLEALRAGLAALSPLDEAALFV